jgi:hypothetical protein
MKTEIIVKRHQYRETTHVIAQTVVPTARGNIALDLVRHLALAVCEPTTGSEDSAGRQMVRLLSPAEVANRGCQIAEEIWLQFMERGWLMDVPPPEYHNDKEPA